MKGKVVWLTGLPCSGKTCIANALAQHMSNPLMLDGDVIRNTHISSDVGFSPEDRKKHILRMGSIAKIVADTGKNVICSFVSPNQEVREQIKSEIPTFVEVFVDVPAEICAERDVKGMWAKAKAGEIKGFTGYDAPYDAPEFPGVVCKAGEETLEESVDKILKFLNVRFARALYIGRWQTPNGLHDGHRFIINQSLDKGIPVAIGIRDTFQASDNPYSAHDLKKIIEKQVVNEDIEVFVMPNIRSINIGRKVGYDIIKIKSPEEIEAISATEIRSKSKEIK